MRGVRSVLPIFLFVSPLFSFCSADENNIDINQISTDVDIVPFRQAWNLVTKVYINRGNIDKEKMMTGAIRGLMKSLNDPLCDFYINSKFEEFANYGKVTAVLCQIISVKTKNGQSLKIGHITISHFAKGVAESLKKMAEEFHLNGINKIILDLRFSVGGQIAVADEVCSAFLGKGIPLYIKDDGNGQKMVYSSDDRVFKNIPDLCLIGRATASASEIVASALNENASCVLVGDRTTGKGTIQSAIDIGLGRIYLTSAKFLTSKGRTIDKVGIEPDIKVKLLFEDLRTKRDLQLKKALEILRNGEVK